MYAKTCLVEQACAAFGASANPIGPNCWKVGSGIVEFDPTRAYRRWESERADDEGNTVIRQYDHAYEAVRSVA